MTITLGTVTLDPHVSRRRRYNYTDVPGNERTTLGGRTCIQRLGSGDNMDILLEAIEEDNVRKGYFLASQLAAIAAYRDSGEPIDLTYHGVTDRVVVKIDGINVEKVLWSSQDSADEKYIGTIALKKA